MPLKRIFSIVVFAKNKDPSPFAGCDNGVNTALGCIPYGSSEAFAQWFFNHLLGIAGGIALLLIIYGSFKIITSGGNPEKVKEGKSFITSALSGLLFMILSLFLLKFIGVDVLHLPGLEK